MKPTMILDDGTDVLGQLGKRLNSDVRDEEHALLEGSATKCGHFPHHMPLGPGGAQQLLLESQGRRGGAMRINKTPA